MGFWCSWFKNLFAPVECYCQCHSGGYNKDAIAKGGVQVVTCEHCLVKGKPKKVKKWGTAIPR